MGYGYGGGGYRGGTHGRRGGFGIIAALILAAVALFRYLGSSEVNTVTGEKQRVAGISARQEIALGLQAGPQMLRQHGGPSPDAAAARRVDAIGERLVRTSDASRSPYRWEFHLLADRQTVNAFALPGGQVFLTEALYRRLTTDGQLAGVLGHEIGHVVGRHGAERIAKQQLTQGLTGAAVLATYDPNNPNSARNAAVAAMLGQLVNMKFGRGDELESDALGVRFLAQAGYDPRAMVGVMKVLAAAGGGTRRPEFFSTHPNPENRIQRIEDAIRAAFPEGVPGGLEP